MMYRKTNVGFSTKLLPLLSNKDNSVLSPYGIATVLSMASEGASEYSCAEILSCLGLNSLDELRASVLNVVAAPCDAFQNKNAITLMKGDDTIELLDTFKQVMTDTYAASIDSKPTDGESSVCLKNKTQFKATWLYKMERDTEQDSCFRNADQSWCRPVFLSCTEQMRYYKDKEFNPTAKAVALPYQFNNEKTPFELVLVDTKKPLCEVLLQEIFSKMKKGKCEVAFPEFSISSEYDLIPMMKALGLENIFDEEVEAFDKIATTPLYAEAFTQKAEIQVDETGTVAKAVTSMFMFACKSCVTPEIETIRFTEPFCYFLCNTDTGDILFMGWVNKLSNCERKKHSFDLSSLF